MDKIAVGMTVSEFFVELGEHQADTDHDELLLKHHTKKDTNHNGRDLIHAPQKQMGRLVNPPGNFNEFDSNLLSQYQQTNTHYDRKHLPSDDKA